MLLLAYACSPYRGSEPGVGWNRAVQTARHYDTWVLCEEHEFAADIRRYLDANGPIDGLHFCFVPLLSHEQRLRHLPVIGNAASLQDSSSQLTVVAVSNPDSAS